MLLFFMYNNPAALAGFVLSVDLLRIGLYAFRNLDAPAVFARDIEELETFVRIWCQPEPDRRHVKVSSTSVGIFSWTKCRWKPTTIIYPTDFLPVENSYQQSLLDNIVADIAAVYQIPTRRVSIRDFWRINPPRDAQGKSLEAYLERVSHPSIEATTAQDSIGTPQHSFIRILPQLGRLSVSVSGKVPPGAVREQSHAMEMVSVSRFEPIRPSAPY